jgi:hypothetical protein
VLSIILVPLTNKLPVTDVPLEITVSAIVDELAFVEEDNTIWPLSTSNAIFAVPSSIITYGSVMLPLPCGYIITLAIISIYFLILLIVVLYLQ